MFDIGFIEMLAVAIIALLVLGPERLPVAVRAVGLTLGRIKRGFADVKKQIEKEVGADEIRQQLHNEKILANLEKQEREAGEATRRAEALDQQPAPKTASNVRKRASSDDTRDDRTAAPDAASETATPPVNDTQAGNEEKG
ncbi:Sec-independent protein translocase protein TatB [Halopseudomonas salegens]|uniref:Sec-independent protein translocase protein TatB n=1 Tax=Halopseudomonas salegens TaxID=1434072 RepID=A0A1H2H8I3_9GAMM|nr:Sec-independent protein translocase protein TatB [Halopseudomonas salegens]SDU28124.1 sec-independent protein translocase protein TatB [Halopseudomonas salegens]